MSDKSGFDGFTRIAEAIERQNKLLEDQVDLSRKIRWELWTTRRETEVLRTAATTPLLDEVEAFADERQLSFLQTLETIRDEQLSFARFGDGELKIMLRDDYNLKFQPNSPELSAALKQVLTDAAANNKILIGFPHMHRNVEWSGVWMDVWERSKPFFKPITRFGKTHVSRPIFFNVVGQRGVEAWRSVWEGLRVKVVTGKDSRFDLIPELFSSAASVTFEDSLPTNAFTDVPRLVEKLADDDSNLVLIALGPAGTVLASELAKAGKRALDVGHISASYENVFSGGAWPESLPVTVS